MQSCVDREAPERLLCQSGWGSGWGSGSTEGEKGKRCRSFQVTLSEGARGTLSRTPPCTGTPRWMDGRVNLGAGGGHPLQASSYTRAQTDTGRRHPLVEAGGRSRWLLPVSLAPTQEPLRALDLDHHRSLLGVQHSSQDAWIF